MILTRKKNCVSNSFALFIFSVMKQTQIWWGAFASFILSQLLRKTGCLILDWPQDVTSVPWKFPRKGIYLVMQNLSLKEERSWHTHIATPTISNKIWTCRGSFSFTAYNQSWSRLGLSLKKSCHLWVKPLNLTAQSCYLIAPEEKSPCSGVNNQYQIFISLFRSLSFSPIFFKSFICTSKMEADTRGSNLYLNNILRKSWMNTPRHQRDMIRHLNFFEGTI